MISTPLSAETATPGQRGAGIAMMLSGSAANQVGAAAGALAFPVIGPVGVVAMRQFVAAAVLLPVVRPRLHRLHRDQWLPVIGLAVVFSVMNLGLYTAIDRIGLGLAVTLEFLGPLGVALAGSRRLADIACAGLAAVGVVILTHPGSSTDVFGIACALLAAAGWACYILLNRTLGQRLPGLQGTAAASTVSAALWLPIATLWFAHHPPTLRALGLGVLCGLLASIAPYVADLLALRRVPAAMFSLFTSISPVWAALSGWIVLHQGLGLDEWGGIALIVISNLLFSIRKASAGPRGELFDVAQPHRSRSQPGFRTRRRVPPVGFEPTLGPF